MVRVSTNARTVAIDPPSYMPHHALGPPRPSTYPRRMCRNGDCDGAMWGQKTLTKSR